MPNKLQDALVEIEQLRRENTNLRTTIASLEHRLSFFDQHPTTGEGKRGERFLAQALSAALTSHKSSFDLVTGSGVHIEVKSSRLNTVNTAATKRWVWNQIFGLNGRKVFDYLILMGEVDGRFSSHYPGNAPYVFLLLDYATAMTFAKGESKGKYIQLTSNPTTTLALSNPLWKQMISLDEMESRFGAISEINEF